MHATLPTFESTDNTHQHKLTTYTGETTRTVHKLEGMSLEYSFVSPDNWIYSGPTKGPNIEGTFAKKMVALSKN
jgi:hypothetical protein